MCRSSSQSSSTEDAAGTRNRSAAARRPPSTTHWKSRAGWPRRTDQRGARDLKPENFSSRVTGSREDPRLRPGECLDTRGASDERILDLNRSGDAPRHSGLRLAGAGARHCHRSSADIFSLGSCCQMIAGVAPFQRESAFETLHAILKEEPTTLREHDERVPAPLDQICATVWRRTATCDFIRRKILCSASISSDDGSIQDHAYGRARYPVAWRRCSGCSDRQSARSGTVCRPRPTATAERAWRQ